MMSKIQSQYDSLINSGLNNLNSNKDIFSENYHNNDTIKNLSKINNINDESIAITEFKDDDKIECKNDKNILMMIVNKIDNL